MPAKVLIWPNGSFLKAATRCGHAAMMVERWDSALGHVHAEDCYISWWPSNEEVKKKDRGPLGSRRVSTHSLDRDLLAEMGDRTRQRLANGTIQPRPGQYQVNPDDPGTWVQHPQYVITIPGLGETMLQADGIGLNLQRMRDWWSVFRASPNRVYRFASHTHNCASVIGAALQAGGSHLFHKPFSSWTWATPMEVKAYAEEVRDRILDISGDVQAIRGHRVMVNQQVMPTVGGLGTPELWSYEDWYKASYVGRFARRKEQVAAIDKLLQEYHRLGNWWGEGLDVEQFDKKWNLVRQMLEQVHDHLRCKPTSDRGQAVLALGRQLLAVIEHYKSFIGMVEGMHAAEFVLA